MYKLILSVMAIAITLTSFSQFNAKPKVAWRYHDIPPTIINETNVYVKPGSGVIKGSNNTFADSGEDWWYDIQNLYEGSQHVGYILCGFGTWQNIFYSEVGSGGCRNKPLTEINCKRPVVDDRQIGPKLTTVAKYDLQGNMVWCRAQASAEEGAIAIATTRDGGSIFTGWVKQQEL